MAVLVLCELEQLEPVGQCAQLPDHFVLVLINNDHHFEDVGALLLVLVAHHELVLQLLPELKQLSSHGDGHGQVRLEAVLLTTLREQLGQVVVGNLN